MTTIWKFPFSISDRVTLEMPKGARVLKIESQLGKPCLWALVDTTQPMESRRFRVFGTGHEIDLCAADLARFVGTFQMPPFVWHVFEETQPPCPT